MTHIKFDAPEKYNQARGGFLYRRKSYRLGSVRYGEPNAIEYPQFYRRETGTIRIHHSAGNLTNDSS